MGFTLIELLIVIAVIAMLMGILVPISHTAREQTRAVVCGSNLKQLSLALTAYGQENETFPYGFDASDVGTVVPPPRYPGNALYDWAGWWWFTAVAGSLTDNFGKKTIFLCPSRNIQDPGVKANILCGNYGVNRAICKDAISRGSEFVGAPLALHQIRRPAETLLITDSGYSLISWRGASNASGPYFDNPRREDAFYVPGLAINKERILEGTISRGCELDAIDGRHPNKTVNVIFADSHLTRVKADELFVEETDGSYSNRSPLWLPR